MWIRVFLSLCQAARVRIQLKRLTMQGHDVSGESLVCYLPVRVATPTVIACIDLDSMVEWTTIGINAPTCTVRCLRLHVYVEVGYSNCARGAGGNVGVM